MRAFRRLMSLAALVGLGLSAGSANAALINYSATATQSFAIGTFNGIYDSTGFGGLGSLTGTITWTNMPILQSVRAFDRSTDGQMSNFGGPYLPDPGEEFDGSQAVFTFWSAADHAVAEAGQMELVFTALDGNPRAFVQTSAVPAPGAVGLFVSAFAAVALRIRRRMA
jgi:hypothetical protein